MKAKELIKILESAPEAEVGYEHLRINNAWVDSDEYIELDGGVTRSEYINNKSGVFVVMTEYEDTSPEVNCIYMERERAEKAKEWLEKYGNDGRNKIKKVTIYNMFIIK